MPNTRDQYDEIAERWIKEANDDIDVLWTKRNTPPDCYAEAAKRLDNIFKDRKGWKSRKLRQRKGQEHGALKAIDEDRKKLLDERESILPLDGFAYGKNVKRVVEIDKELEGLDFAEYLISTTAAAT